MTTYLSEESANALLTLVKEAKTSGSYNDKIHKLTKSGILPGGQTYSNRAAEVFPPVQADWLNGGAGADATGVWNFGTGALPDMARNQAAMNLLKRVTTIVNLTTTGLSAGQLIRVLHAFFTGRQLDPALFEAFNDTAKRLDAAAGNTAYVDALTYTGAAGLVKELATLIAYQYDSITDPKISEEINALVLSFKGLGLSIEDIIKEGPAYLSTIPDGTYSFTVNQVNTTQPGILTGTAVITSQNDRYTGRLEQKLINNNIVGAVPITALQTLDAYYNSIQVDTTGSSYNGKYTVTGNTATITSNGYSQAAGEFVETVTTIISSIFSFYVINSIINPDKSQTIISLTIYTRQLKSAEIKKVIEDAFKVADEDKDGVLKLHEAVEAGNRLAAIMTGQIKFDAAGLASGDSITGEQFKWGFAVIDPLVGPH